MTDYRQNLTEEQKVIFLHALQYILSVETRCRPENEQYLRRQALAIGFDAAHLKKIKPLKKTEELVTEMKKIEDIRLLRFFLREMVLLAVADHELTDNEMKNIYKIGLGVGIREEKIDDFFLWAAQGLEWQLDGQRLIEKDI